MEVKHYALLTSALVWGE